MLPVYRALLPRVEHLIPYLGRIDEARWYSNRGALVELLEGRLGELLGDAGAKVTTASSGTAAIEAAILATAGRATRERPLALLPAYTFIATALAVEACGFTPYLLDVDASTWALDPHALIGHPALSRAGIVVPVAPYGCAFSQNDWLTFRDQTGIPVVIDAAAAVEAMIDDPHQTTGSIPVALSFQATKAFSTGEGGAVVWSDTEGLTRVARALNFGMLYSRASTTAGLNGKLSEYHAAVGLASLDGWEERRRANGAVVALYQSVATAYGLAAQLSVAPALASNYAVLDAGSEAMANEVIAVLQAERIETRRWYGLGLHRETHLEGVERDALVNTERIAPLIVGLPIACDISASQIECIMRAAATVLTCKAPV